MVQPALLDQLPFLASLCWQGEQSSVVLLDAEEILQIYERHWRYLGVMADLSEFERIFVHRLAMQYRSWLAQETKL